MIQDRLIEQVKEAERKALSKNPSECIAGLNFINGMMQGAYYSIHMPLDIHDFLNKRLSQLIQDRIKSSSTHN